MNCGHCGADVPEAAMFCPECGTDVRAASDDGGATAAETASDDAASAGDDARTADVAAGGTADAGAAAGETTGAPRPVGDDDAFDWGVDEGTAGGDGGTVYGNDAGDAGDDAGEGGADAGDRGYDAGDAGDDAGDDVKDADDEDDEPFPEPTRLSRPPDSRHPEPVMGTHDEVVGERIGAFVVDRILLWSMFVAPVLLGGVLSPVAGDTVGGLVVLFGLAGAVLAALVYAFVLEGLYGQTPGKRLLGIVVVKEDGEPCTYGASIVRSLLWMVDRYFLGMIALGFVLTTDRSQRFGDIVADTVVVKTA